MRTRLSWLTAAIRVAIVPVFFGALVLLSEPERSAADLAAAAGLLLLSAIHVGYWWQGWFVQTRYAVAALIGMVVINSVLLNLLDVAQPLLWLYPALIAGAGLRAPIAIVGVALTALAAAAPIVVESSLVHPIGAVPAGVTLGASHSVLLSIVLAGLGMTAARQLIAVNVDLEATREQLADLAVAAERERLARELHDLLGRTLSLIAVKAELASRLSAKGDLSAENELGDVQRLARQAVRDVREAVTGGRAPTLTGELAAADAALRTAGIEVTIRNSGVALDPAHETTIAGALREAVTNVVKHSGARTCCITVDATDSSTTLEVEDDGRGPTGDDAGTGLKRLAERVRAHGGTLDVGQRDAIGFWLRVQLSADVPRSPHGAAA